MVKRKREIKSAWHDVQAKEALHLGVSLGLFLALDKYLKNVFLANGVCFPSALFGMMTIFVLLSSLSSINANAASRVESFLAPAILFIQRWLPLFYAPSLVVVPLAVKGIPAAEGAKIAAIFGMSTPQSHSPRLIPKFQLAMWRLQIIE